MIACVPLRRIGKRCFAAYWSTTLPSSSGNYLILILIPRRMKVGYVEVFILVLVAIGLFEVATLRIGVDEVELVLIDGGLLFFAQL